jgi:hypothetical protein
MVKTIDLSFDLLVSQFGIDSSIEEKCDNFKLKFSKNNAWFCIDKFSGERLKLLKSNDEWLFFISFKDKKTKESFFITEQMFNKLINKTGISNSCASKIIVFFLSKVLDKASMSEYLLFLEENEVFMKNLRKGVEYE